MKEINSMIKELIEKMKVEGAVDKKFVELADTVLNKLARHQKIKEQLDSLENIEDAILVFNDGIGTITREPKGLSVGILKGTVIQLDITADEMPGNNEACTCPKCTARRMGKSLQATVNKMNRGHH